MPRVDHPRYSRALAGISPKQLLEQKPYWASRMSLELAQKIISRLDKMKGDRYNYDSQWQEIGDFMDPFRADFTIQRTPGEKRMQYIFDGTAMYSSDNLADSMWSLTINSATKWFELETSDSDLNKDDAVKKWFEDCANRMMSQFGRNSGRFYSSAMEMYRDLGLFGTGVLYLEERKEEALLMWRCFSIASCYLGENYYGNIDTLFRPFKLSVRQIIQKWKDTASKHVLEKAEKNPDEMIEIIHAVAPRADLDGGNSQEFASVYMESQTKTILEKQYYKKFPYFTPRWSTRSGNIYGDSPAMRALPDVKMLNRMESDIIRNAEKQTNGMWLAEEELARKNITMRPGQIIPGALRNGNPLIVPLPQNGGDPRIGFETSEQRREMVKNFFYVNLLNTIENPNMTATEAMIRQQEQQRQMAPHLARLHSEFLDPVVTRVFDMMLDGGYFIEQPPTLQEYKGQLRVNYVSPLARAQKNADGMGVINSVQTVGMLAQLDPSVIDNINPDGAANAIFAANGMPASAIRSPEEMADIRKQRAQQQQAQQMVEAAQPVSSAAKNMAEAEQINEGGQRVAA